MSEFKFAFPCAYGGVVESANPPMIHNMIRDLRRAVGELDAKKQSGGPMFPVKSAKELHQKLAEALDALNMVAAPVDQSFAHVDCAEQIPNNANKAGNTLFRTMVHVKTTVRVIAPDTSYLDIVGSGHGGDVDDKAGGKASTYSWKDALLKGLTIPNEMLEDTDDEAPSQPAKGKVVALQGGSDVDRVLGLIAACTAMDQLKALGAAIKAGEYNIHGSDRARLNDPYVAKVKELSDNG